MKPFFLKKYTPRFGQTVALGQQPPRPEMLFEAVDEAKKHQKIVKPSLDVVLSCAQLCGTNQ